MSVQLAKEKNKRWRSIDWDSYNQRRMKTTLMIRCDLTERETKNSEKFPKNQFWSGFTRLLETSFEHLNYKRA
jgi:hypothetical protein